MEFFLTQDSKKTGPFTRLQIREMLVSGEIDGDTQGWMQGEDSWKPLREIDPVLGVIQSVEQEQLSERLASQKGPPVLPESTIPPHRISSHAIARFIARSFDVMFFYVIALALFAPGAAPKPDFGDEIPSWSQFADTLKSAEMIEYQERIAPIWLGAFIGAHLFEIIFITAFGTTIGKMLFRIRVLNHRGERLKLSQSVSRVLLVYFLGMGMGYLPMQLLLNFFAYRRLGRRSVTFWDEQLHCQVFQDPMSRTRALLGVLFLFLVSVLSVVVVS